MGDGTGYGWFKTLQQINVFPILQLKEKYKKQDYIIYTEFEAIDIHHATGDETEHHQRTT